MTYACIHGYKKVDELRGPVQVSSLLAQSMKRTQKINSQLGKKENGENQGIQGKNARADQRD